MKIVYNWTVRDLNIGTKIAIPSDTAGDDQTPGYIVYLLVHDSNQADTGPYLLVWWNRINRDGSTADYVGNLPFATSIYPRDSGSLVAALNKAGALPQKPDGSFYPAETEHFFPNMT